MSENGEEGTSSPAGDPSQEIKKLQDPLAQLQRENESLCASATATKSAELFFARLTQGIDKVIKKYKPPKDPKDNENQEDPEHESEDSHTETSDRSS